ncbi:MAG: hypothetical protein AB8G95_19500 [Anaerolineae bacterium]
MEFKIFHESTKPQNAERSVRQMKNHNQCEFEVLSSELYLHKGSVVNCKTIIHADTWEEFVFKVIRFSQSFGYSWLLSGNIQNELHLSTKQVHSGQGISLIDISVGRETFTKGSN